jgi:HAD superfamily hydrolase (TIGR01509 family)
MGLPDRFDFLCMSCEIGFLKPSAQAFQIALERMELPPCEVLFLDDGAVNVDAARSLGMAAHVVKNPVQAESALKEHGIL